MVSKLYYSLVDFKEKLNREEKSFVENPENAYLFPADDKQASGPGQGKEKANAAKNQKEVGCRCFSMIYPMKFVGLLDKVSQCSLKLYSKLLFKLTFSSPGVNSRPSYVLLIDLCPLVDHH